jgi:hypothetical protein
MPLDEQDPGKPAPEPEDRQQDVDESPEHARRRRRARPFVWAGLAIFAEPVPQNIGQAESQVSQLQGTVNRRRHSSARLTST